MLDNLPRGIICIEDIETGMSRHIQKVVTNQDIEMFVQVSTDHNPVHLDDAYAKDTIFEGSIALVPGITDPRSVV
jgi:3-hydroxybutyryl-CoA dehydratase